jgi:23S rRNA (cytidine1920-2'-O)/16S rRNA (cytidine1409-2'-O)-methyltransferase
VVREPAIHARVLAEIADAVAARGLEPLDAIASPILGPEGNREFLLRARVPSLARREARTIPARLREHLSNLAGVAA